MGRSIWIIVGEDPYGVKRHFSLKFSESLLRHNIKTEIFEIRDNLIDVFRTRMRAGKPDLCCSFYIPHVVAESWGEIWAEHQVPFWFILLDPAFYFDHLYAHPWALFSSTDYASCHYIRDRGCSRVFFWGHAVEQELFVKSDIKRDIEIVYFGTSYDPIQQRKIIDSLPEIQQQLINKAALIFLEEKSINHIEAIQTAAARLDVKTEAFDPAQYKFLLKLLDGYTRALDRVELIASLKDVPIHIYGGACYSPSIAIKGWNSYFGANDNVTIHPAVSFEEACSIFKRSRICLNSMPFSKQGTHERIFYAQACGCLLLTTHTRWVEENYAIDEELLTYHFHDKASVTEKLNYFLNNEQDRSEIACKGTIKAHANHTWDTRVLELLSFLDGIGQS